MSLQDADTASGRDADDSDYPHDDSDYDSDIESCSDSEAGADMVRSPARLVYNLSGLSEGRRAAVRDVFRDPPDLALQRCRRVDDVYAFQMTELVTRSVRIRERPGDNAASRLTCSCREDDHPCSHVVWLLDQLVKATTYNHDHTKPFHMTAEGYATELGDPFETISNFHLHVLADALHCRVVGPEEDQVDRLRALEARELLASVHDTPVDEFRPDLLAHLPASGDPVLKPGHLDETIFRMLLDNDHFFHYFTSHSRLDAFRALLHRADHVLHEFDGLSSVERTSRSTRDERVGDAAWAAGHLKGIVQLIRSSIFIRARPLRRHEARSAVRTLIHILASVVARNGNSDSGAAHNADSLYSRLIGDESSGASFVVAELDLLPEAASRALDDLQHILQQVTHHRSPAAFVQDFRIMVERLREQPSEVTGWKKRRVQGQGSHRDSKRVK